jgi:hypothetical protein
MKGVEPPPFMASFHLVVLNKKGTYITIESAGLEITGLQKGGLFGISRIIAPVEIGEFPYDRPLVRSAWQYRRSYCNNPEMVRPWPGYLVITGPRFKKAAGT